MNRELYEKANKNFFFDRTPNKIYKESDILEACHMPGFLNNEETMKIAEWFDENRSIFIELTRYKTLDSLLLSNVNIEELRERIREVRKKNLEKINEYYEREDIPLKLADAIDCTFQTVTNDLYDLLKSLEEEA
jgi:hypothetical protein